MSGLCPAGGQPCVVLGADFKGREARKTAEKAKTTQAETLTDAGKKRMEA